MSMTTLGAQLAALNSSQGGSALATSRRHEDAVGRGLHHSVQVGHSLVGHKSHIFKASILYQDARQASNVPLTTLQENCVAALEELQTVDPLFGNFVGILCQSSTERGLLSKTENEEIDTAIQDLLYRLSLRMTSKTEGVDTVTCGLNVIEYLIRQYDLYLRPKLVSTVLLVWLPHHEHSYFLRWLQLVDLANLPTWTWLRPYAIPNAKVGRDAIAKAVSKNVALCRDILLLSSKAATLPEADTTMSFTAAVLVEAMTLQQRSSGMIDERTCHALLPTIRRACLSVSKNPIFANWGYVLASTIVEMSCLADEPRKGLVTSILQGFSQPKSKASEDDVDMQDADAKSTNDGAIQNAFIVVMTLLQQQPPITESYNNDDTSNITTSQLSVGANKTLYGYPNSSCIGSKLFWQALLAIDGVPSLLAGLLVDDGFVDVIHLATSLWVVGWHRLEKARLKSSSKHEPLETFLTDLLHEPRLSLHLWSKPEWIEALVCFVLTNTKIDGDNPSFLQTVLASFRRKSISAYERGITQGLLRSKRQVRLQLAAYLGLAASPSESNSEGKDDVASIQLPPRVALDHADVEIRLKAIDRVMSEQQDDAMDVDSADESVTDALLRRVLSDEDIQVATKASKAICDHLDQKQKKTDTVISLAFADHVLQALYKWAEWSQSDPKSKSALICHLLHLVALAANKLKDAGHDGPMAPYVEALGAYLIHSDVAIAKEAAKGIVAAMTGKKGSKASDNEARQVVVSHSNRLLDQFARMDQELPKTEQIFRRRFVPSLLKSYSETLSQRSAKVTDEDKSKAALSYCLWIVTEHAKNLSNDERVLLLNVLKRTVGVVATNPKLLSSTFVTFLAVDEALFDEVTSPFVMEVCKMIKDKNGKNVSPLVVVSEFALRPTIGNEAVVRLVSIAKDLVPSETSHCHLALVPALALLENPEPGVRQVTVGLISVLGEQLEKHKTEEFRQLSVICKYITENESSALLGSPSFLSECLQVSASKSKKDQSFQKTILKLTRYCMSSTTGSSDAAHLPVTGWQDFEDAIGGHAASLIVLVAAEAVGEVTFPLLTRWTEVGKPLLTSLLENNFSTTSSSTLKGLLDHATILLKGMKVTDALNKGTPDSNVIIMSGPGSTGGRNRSYSFGKCESTNFLFPYPQDMAEMIVSILSKQKFPRHVRNTLSEKVLASASWGNFVFSKLAQNDRLQITSASLNAMVEDLSDFAESAFFSLPNSCEDVAQILEKQSTAGSGIASLTYVADYIAANAQRLTADLNIAKLLDVLFEKFATLSLKTTDDGESSEFARTSLLDALVALLGMIEKDLGLKIALNGKKKFKSWIGSLVGALGSDNDTRYRPVHSVRNKKSSLTVLTYLCSFYPSQVTQELITAVVSMVSATTSEKDASIVTDLLFSVVPVYFNYSSKANLSASDLMHAFIAAANNGIDELTRVTLYRGFVDAISKTEQPRTSDFIGVFLASCLASDVYYSGHGERRAQSAQLASQVLNQVSVSKRVQAVLTIVSHARDLILKMGGEDVESTNDVISTDSLRVLALVGPNGEKINSPAFTSTDRVQQKLCNIFMAATCEIVSSTAFAKYLRHCKDDSSEQVVRLWQDLLLIQSMSNTQLATLEGENSVFWASISEVTSETLASIQLHLPSPIFLAFATSLVKESDSDDLRARALQLVADRSLKLDSTDPEAYLYLDMLPFLTSLLESNVAFTGGSVLQQAAFVAIEHITRKLCFDSEGPGPKYLDTVAESLVKTADVIERIAREIDSGKLKSNVHDSLSVQLLCTATLCAATSVRACGARSIPSLPNLLRPSCQLLGRIHNSGATAESEVDENQSRILQISFLRLISSVVDSIPQFLSPYLGDLLGENVLPTTVFGKADDDLAVTAAAVKLCETIALKIPARQLLLPLTAAITKSETASSIAKLLEIMTLSIKNSKPSELGGKTNLILKAGTFIFDFSGDHGMLSELIKASTNMFIALILKLSELQLRSFYAKLRDWRGDFDKADPNARALRRYCFWYLSASLASELKTIFLPCMTSVFSDAVDELDAAATFLCTKTKVKTAGGTKKQRIDDDNSVEYNAVSFLSLQAVLKCLEASLRSDAHDGGSWIRDGESERFNVMLDPLGRLFHCRVEDTGNKAVSYQGLVQGNNDESGSIVECIVALASAAGDEQKWKPLNHAVLQACSHESRPEVRKAGIHCLLSLIRSIGEEYMLLIPECLPVLSELLEDTDEQIAGLAQECITMSEELLGESLEDNLR